MTQSNQQKTSNAVDPLLETAAIVQRTPLDEMTFRRMIAIERKRTERSKAPFVLMLLEAVSDRGPKKSSITLHRVATALLSASRDTDLVGWYKDDAIVGTMFTGLIVNDKRAVLDTFLAKVSAALQEELTADEFNQVRISFHLFPDDWDHEKPGPPTNAALYPDLVSHDKGQRTVLFVKRDCRFCRKFDHADSFCSAFPRHRSRHQTFFPGPGVLPPAKGRPLRSDLHFPQVPLHVCEQ